MSIMQCLCRLFTSHAAPREPISTAQRPSANRIHVQTHTRRGHQGASLTVRRHTRNRPGRVR